MQIGKPLRTVVVEPLELPVSESTAFPRQSCQCPSRLQPSWDKRKRANKNQNYYVVAREGPQEKAGICTRNHADCALQRFLRSTRTDFTDQRKKSALESLDGYIMRISLWGV